jgi:hypothetical protein
MSLLSGWRMDKTHVEVVSIYDETNDREYWMAQPVEARWAALELLRQIAYGYDPATTRLQRVLEVVEHEPR